MFAEGRGWVHCRGEGIHSKGVLPPLTGPVCHPVQLDTIFGLREDFAGALRQQLLCEAHMASQPPIRRGNQAASFGWSRLRKTAFGRGHH